MSPQYSALIARVLIMIFNNASPAVLRQIREQILSFQAFCYETENQWDDALAYALEPILFLIPKD